MAVRASGLNILQIFSSRFIPIHCLSFCVHLTYHGSRTKGLTNYFPVPGGSEDVKIPELIPGLRPTNDRRRYFITTSLIGWAQI